jgi:serine/threonine-protein kinase
LSGVSATGNVGTVSVTGTNSLVGVLSIVSPGYVNPIATGTQGIVPYLVGVSEGQARYLLIYSAMNVGVVTYSPSATVAQGLVSAQSIAGGTTQPLYTQVNFIVSSGPPGTQPTTTVPFIVGLPSYQAGLAISGAQLILNTFTYSTSAVVPAGNVISQSLTAGTTVATGTLIVVTVSVGPTPVASTTVVPNVTGLYLWDAVRILTQAQLIIEPWLYAKSSTVAAEYIISQSVVAGTTVPTWAPITLTVSDGA